MYFPYLRGKQFDLIALKELGDIMQTNSSKISPIIEPVKDSSTLKSTLKDLASRNINFNIIINPKVGDLINSPERILSILESELREFSNYQIAAIVEGNFDYLGILSSSRINPSGFTLIHNEVLPDPAGIVKQHSEIYPVLNNVVNFQSTNRRYDRNFEPSTVVSLEDFFNSQNKNADYLSVIESFFSEEHLFFSRDGIKGFSDYLTIGENYSESGFLPYAVAIHLTFPDADGKLHVRHFVSDSNDDTSDIGGKFIEALDKLIEWVDRSNLNTVAISKLQELHENGHFPGLGSLKKLSIMNHIELVLRLI